MGQPRERAPRRDAGRIRGEPIRRPCSRRRSRSSAISCLEASGSQHFSRSPTGRALASAAMTGQASSPSATLPERSLHEEAQRPAAALVERECDRVGCRGPLEPAHGTLAVGAALKVLAKDMPEQPWPRPFCVARDRRSRSPLLARRMRCRARRTRESRRAREEASARVRARWLTSSGGPSVGVLAAQSRGGSHWRRSAMRLSPPSSRVGAGNEWKTSGAEGSSRTYTPSNASAWKCTLSRRPESPRCTGLDGVHAVDEV